MSSRLANNALWAMTALLAAGAVAALVLGALLPLQSDNPPDARDAAAAANSRAASLPSVSMLEPIWNLRLRAELSLSPASDTQTQLAADLLPSSDLPLTLIGTIGKSLAILQDSRGEVEVKAVGETWNGIEIVQIRPLQIDVRHNGKVMTLKKASEQGSGM